MQGTAGNVIPPDGFLRAVQAIAREHGALLIADEMITGFGRTGAMWGCDHDGVVPDIMTVGKGVGGGYPLSCVVSTDTITTSKPWSNPSASSSSYGGSPLASAAGLAALEIILKEDLVKNAERVGKVMLDRLEALKEKDRCVGEVRGRGLMLSIELVRDRTNKEPLSKTITDARPDQRDLVSARAPGGRRYTTSAGLLAEACVDFVGICTPPSSHAPLIRQALERGCHVLCEKPLVSALDDLAPLARLAEKTGRALHTVHNWHHAPIVRRTADLIREGQIGRVEHGIWHTLRTRPASAGDERTGNWRVDPAVAGGGVLSDHGWPGVYIVPPWVGG